MTEEEKEAKKQREIEKAKPKTVYVPEVVREPRIHFFQVPKLGSYLSIELKYASCLYEDAFDQAYKDYLECAEKQKEQDAEIKEWEE